MHRHPRSVPGCTLCLPAEDPPHGLGEVPDLPPAVRLLSDALATAHDFYEASERLREVMRGASAEALTVTARIVAAGEQPETTLAADLVRVEAALARVRSLLDWPVGRATNGVDRLVPAEDLRRALDGDSTPRPDHAACPCGWPRRCGEPDCGMAGGL